MAQTCLLADTTREVDMAVPRITQQVQEQPLGMPAQRPMRSVADATRVSDALAGLGRQLEQTAAISAEVIRKKNRLAAKEAAAKYDAAIDTLETEYQATHRGIKAQDLEGTAEKELTRVQGEASADLTDAQRAIFDRYARQQRASALNRAVKFQNSQLADAEIGVNSILVERAQRNYASDPSDDQRAVARKQIGEAIESSAQVLGWTPERKQAEIEKAFSTSDTVIVSALIENGDFGAAVGHMERYSATMTPKNKLLLEQRIDAGLRVQSIDTAVDAEFAAVVKAGGGMPTYVDWDKRLAAIDNQYGDFAEEIKQGLQVMIKEWTAADDMASQGQYGEFVAQTNAYERTPAGYMAARDNIINKSRNALVRDKALAHLERTLGPEAGAYDASEPIGGAIKYDFGNAVQAGQLGPITDENIPFIMAKGMEFGLKKKDIQSVIEQARKADGISQTAVRTAVGRATKTSGKDNWLDAHPEVWRDIEQFAQANPAMTQAEANEMAINMAVAVTTDAGLATVGDVSRFERDYGDVMLYDISDASIVEVNEARSYLKNNALDPTEENISRRVAGQRIANIIDIRNNIKARMEGALRMKLPTSPGTKYGYGDDRAMPAFDSASEARQSMIRRAYDMSMPEGEAIRKYGQAARDYYAVLDWAVSDDSTEQALEYVEEQSLQSIQNAAEALARPFSNLFAP